MYHFIYNEYQAVSLDILVINLRMPTVLYIGLGTRSSS